MTERRDAPMDKRLIDISENNGEPQWLPIDWPAVVRTGHLNGVIVRAALGILRPDHAFATNWQALRQSPLIQGVYSYCVPTGGPTLLANARAHAEYLWRLVEQQGGPHADDLPPMLDVEITNGLTATQLTEWADTALTALQAVSGRVPVLYSYEAFFTEFLAPLVHHWPILVSAYQLRPPALRPSVGWQYTNASRVPGIATPVDRDHWWTGAWPGTAAWTQTFVSTKGAR